MRRFAGRFRAWDRTPLESCLFSIADSRRVPGTKIRTPARPAPSLRMKSTNHEEPAGVRTEDEAEFAALMERQWRFAFRVAWAVLRNAHDAEDAAQEVFLRILRAQAWRGLRDERAFVARAAWRTAVETWSSPESRRRRLADSAANPAAESPVEDLPDGRLGPEENAVAANWEAAVHRLIDALPEELRQPLALSVEFSSREIAAAMGIPEGTVRTRLMRARQMLRDKMAALEERRYARRL
jgi:RNA polymerase sigma-70 factor, ECF subfamily